MGATPVSVSAMSALLSLLLVVGALAQTPALPGLTLSLPPADAVAEGSEQRALLEKVSALRWPGAAQVSLELEAGDEVEIVARGEGGLVRVRRGTDFGWVDEARLGPAPTP